MTNADVFRSVLGEGPWKGVAHRVRLCVAPAKWTLSGRDSPPSPEFGVLKPAAKWERPA